MVNNISEISIRKGVLQACILSSLFFNLYSEVIFTKALKILNIIHADDPAVIASSLLELHNLWILWQDAANVTVCITKFYLALLWIHSHVVELISSLKHLDIIINDRYDSRKKILLRIEQVRRTFISMKFFLLGKSGDIFISYLELECWLLCLFHPSLRLRELNHQFHTRNVYWSIRNVSIPTDTTHYIFEKVTNIKFLKRMQKKEVTNMNYFSWLI